MYEYVWLNQKKSVLHANEEWQYADNNNDNKPVWLV